MTSNTGIPVNTDCEIESFYNRYFFFTTLGVPEEYIGKRVEFELNNMLNLAWSQTYGNVVGKWMDVTIPTTGEVVKKYLPAEMPAKYSAAQQTMLQREILESYMETHEDWETSDIGCETVANYQIEVDAADFRKDYRVRQLEVLLAIWNRYMPEPWTFTPFRTTATARKTKHAKELGHIVNAANALIGKRKATNGNEHVSDSDMADAVGEVVDMPAKPRHDSEQAAKLAHTERQLAAAANAKKKAGKSK